MSYQTTRSSGLILTSQDYYNLYAGLPAMFGSIDLASKSALTHNSFQRKYLVQANSETDAEFTKRLLWTPYPNLQKKIVNIYQSYLFFNKPILSEGQSDIDLELLARSAAKHSFIGGRCFILTIDKPVVYNVIECVETAPGMFTLFGGTQAETKIDTNRNTIAQGGTIEDLEPGQFTICQYDEFPISLMADTAPINIEIYNLLSVKDCHMYRSLLYYIDGPSIGNDKTPGPYQYIERDGSEAGITISSPNVDSIKMIGDEIQRQTLLMGIMAGLEEEFGAEVVAGDSAIAHEVRILDTNAVITGAAVHISSCVNEAARYYYEKENKTPVEISLNPRLKVMAKESLLGIIDRLSSSIQIDEVHKALQVLALEVGIGQDISQDKLSELKALIENQGGLKATQIGGVMNFDGSILE